jgi:hypothetical protein
MLICFLFYFKFSKLECALYSREERLRHNEFSQYGTGNKVHITAKALTSLKAHQSRTKPLSLKSLSTVVRLKSRGQELNLHSGFTSSCSFKRAVENWAVLPILKTTLMTETLKDINF